MKKVLFAAAILGAAILTSCEKEDPGKNPGGLTALSVTPNEVILNDEETSIRLAVSLTPADAAVTVEWSSSDTLVATVTSKGIVEATGYGECYIYAQVGNLKDSCHVHVKSYLESVIFNGAIVWSVDTTYARDPETGEYTVVHITAGDGSEWNVYPSLATLWVFSDGFYVNNSGDLDGTEKGTVLRLQAPMYYGTQYLNPENGGVQFSLGEWAVFNSSEEQAHVSAPGSMDEAEYVTQMKNFIQSFNAGEDSYSQYLRAASEAFSLPLVNVLEYDAEGESYYNSWIPEGVCEDAYFSLNTDFPASQWMCGLDFSTVTFRTLEMDTVFGSYLVTGLNLGIDLATEQIYFNDEQVHWAPSITSTYGEVPTGEASAAAMKPMQLPIISEHPEMAARLNEQIKNYKVVDLKRKF